MCEFFVKADPILYEQRSRSVRIHGVLTTIRLENMAWDILAQMAAEEGKTTNALIVLFHDEVLRHRGEVPNFASFLRVTCMRFLERRLHDTEHGKSAGSGSRAEAPPSAVPALPAATLRPAALEPLRIRR